MGVAKFIQLRPVFETEFADAGQLREIATNRDVRRAVNV